MRHVEARCANADANFRHIFPPRAAESIRSWLVLMQPPSPHDVLITPPSRPHSHNVSPPIPLCVNLPNVTSPIMCLSASPLYSPHLRTECPCVCLKYCPHNVHKAPETNQGPPLVCQTHSCAENPSIIDHTLHFVSPWTATFTPPMDFPLILPPYLLCTSACETSFIHSSFLVLEPETLGILRGELRGRGGIKASH